jgi:hypothetical protein
MEDSETPQIHKYQETKTTQIMMATVRHVTAWVGCTKYQPAWFLLNRVHQVSFLGIKQPGCGSDHKFLLAPKVSIGRGIPLPPLCTCLACNGTAFTFTSISKDICNRFPWNSCTYVPHHTVSHLWIAYTKYSKPCVSETKLSINHYFNKQTMWYMCLLKQCIASQLTS